MNDVMTVKLATRREIADKLDRLAVSADVKLLMTQLAALTMKVGDAIVEVGRRLMSFVFETVKLFPHITLGVIVGFTMWWLIGSAAILGALLGPIIGPLLVAFGLGVGAMADVADGGLRARVEALAHSFETAGRG